MRSDGSAVPTRASVAALVLALLLAACTGGTSTEAEGGRQVEVEGLAFVVPEGFVDADPAAIGNLVRAFDAPSDEPTGRVGVAIVPDATSVGAYLTSVTRAGTALAGMEPEIVRDDPVDVDGATEAHLLEWSYEGPADAGSPRVRVLQVAVMDEDGDVYDLRYEALEEAWDDEVAAQLERSVALTG
jgi:hypothetical protein